MQAESPGVEAHLFRPLNLLKIHREEESLGGPEWKTPTLAHHLQEHLPSWMNLESLLS